MGGGLARRDTQAPSGERVGGGCAFGWASGRLSEGEEGGGGGHAGYFCFHLSIGVLILFLIHFIWYLHIFCFGLWLFMP